jgi:hypothetical protein
MGTAAAVWAAVSRTAAPPASQALLKELRLAASSPSLACGLRESRHNAGAAPFPRDDARGARESETRTRFTGARPGRAPANLDLDRLRVALRARLDAPGGLELPPPDRLGGSRPSNPSRVSPRCSGMCGCTTSIRHPGKGIPRAGPEIIPLTILLRRPNLSTCRGNPSSSRSPTTGCEPGEAGRGRVRDDRAALGLACCTGREAPFRCTAPST